LIIYDRIMALDLPPEQQKELVEILFQFGAKTRFEPIISGLEYNKQADTSLRQFPLRAVGNDVNLLSHLKDGNLPKTLHEFLTTWQCFDYNTAHEHILKVFLLWDRHPLFQPGVLLNLIEAGIRFPLLEFLRFVRPSADELLKIYSLLADSLWVPYGELDQGSGRVNWYLLKVIWLLKYEGHLRESLMLQRQPFVLNHFRSLEADCFKDLWKVSSRVWLDRRSNREYFLGLDGPLCCR
jgi:hypothetical protein